MRLALSAPGEGAGHGVGVDVVGLAILGDADGGDDGNIVVIRVDQALDQFGVDAGRLADESEIHHLLKMSRRGPAGSRRLLHSDQAARPCPRDPRRAHRPSAAGLGDPAGDFLVDGPGEDHLGHLHGGRIGDPQAVDEGRGDTGPLQHARYLRAAAVHHHGMHAQQLEQDGVGGELLGATSSSPMAWPPYLITTVARS